jgi:hypothetical protein
MSPTDKDAVRPTGGPFRKFTLSDVSTQNAVKSSVQRAIRGWFDRGQKKGKRRVWERATKNRPASPPLLPPAKVCELYPHLEETGAIDDIIPKKAQGSLAKW